jgi:hypothetical protein
MLKHFILEQLLLWLKHRRPRVARLLRKAAVSCSVYHVPPVPPSDQPDHPTSSAIPVLLCFAQLVASFRRESALVWCEVHIVHT